MQRREASFCTKKAALAVGLSARSHNSTVRACPKPDGHLHQYINFFLTEQFAAQLVPHNHSIKTTDPRLSVCKLHLGATSVRIRVLLRFADSNG